MKKRVFTLLLALICCLGMVPASVFASTQLMAPINVNWEQSMRMHWSTVPGQHQNRFLVIVYRRDGSYPTQIWNQEYRYTGQNNEFWEISPRLTEPGSNWKLDHDYHDTMESGEYYFTVRALGDGNNYTDSEPSMQSNILFYEKPEAQLSTPTNLRWEDGKAKWDEVEGCNGYYYQVYYSKTDNFDDRRSGLILGESYRTEEDIWKSYGEGYYWFQVQALSLNMENIRSSNASELSESYFVKLPAQENLKNILSEATGKNADEIRKAVQALGVNDLMDAISSDSGAASGSIATMEKLDAKTGTKVNVVGSGEDSRYQEVSADTKIVGAALNDLESSADEITLNIGAPQREHVLPTMYNNTIAFSFSMGLAGVANQTALKVPVIITIPVPENINPSFLTILHYSQDGSYDEIIPRISAGSEGKTYASFVLTHFSDFIMTERTRALSDEMFTVDKSDSVYTGNAITKTVVGKDNEDVLTLDKDYTVEYRNNTEVGVATITITGIGSYTGTLEYTFNIKASGSSGNNSGNSGNHSGSSGNKGGSGKDNTENKTDTTVTNETVLPFTDVNKGSWFAPAVKYVYDEKLMLGTDTTTFNPSAETTRGMIVSILYRLDGADNSGVCPFSDIAENSYCRDAVTWAAANKIVNGYGDGKFGPDDKITREQMAVILHNYASYKGLNVTGTASLSSYNDDGDIDSYALTAMQWAKAANLISGKPGNILDPLAGTTRAEAATILYNFCENIAK